LCVLVRIKRAGTPDLVVRLEMPTCLLEKENSVKRN
jgi:hypothetical protein